MIKHKSHRISIVPVTLFENCYMQLLATNKKKILTSNGN